MIDKYLFLIRSANREFEEPLETLGVVSLLEVVVVGGGGGLTIQITFPVNTLGLRESVWATYNGERCLESPIR